MIKNIIFDLDGTISKSARGILNAFEYALEKMGKSYQRDKLYEYIGPPLRDSFVKELGEDLADDGVYYYRKYYFKNGLFETSLYEGVKELIEDLYSEGFNIYLATSKGEESSKKILEYFGILQYFSYISGSSNDKNTKKKVIEHLLFENDLKTNESIMIGDRSYDIDASNELAIKSIAVTYGYGKKEEFENADFIVNKPSDIKKIIMER
ncbi:HAD-IA family hydrolase [Anaerococcus vaginalis]|uniref:HAD-IA family hydrolase n=1 Tax=Anaerococcus vaginalis TaxID=33037 RepID=UPI00290BB930|nr:HAD-IA family hydrolase [Anaerococcus vaginalis]MDU5252631.1 HAD-IA family hydrolase [Anaerococcus vaginalis]MDU6781388.1 HAD-IA family hydrolase [Anaerococcus vaginalis]